MGGWWATGWNGEAQRRQGWVGREENYSLPLAFRILASPAFLLPSLTGLSRYLLGSFFSIHRNVGMLCFFLLFPHTLNDFLHPQDSGAIKLMHPHFSKPTCKLSLNSTHPSGFSSLANGKPSIWPLLFSSPPSSTSHFFPAAWLLNVVVKTVTVENKI